MYNCINSDFDLCNNKKKYKFEKHHFLECNQLPSSKEGNKTKWGCAVAFDDQSCYENRTWWSQCCTWDGTKCVSKYPSKLFINFMIIFILPPNWSINIDRSNCMK